VRLADDGGPSGITTGVLMISHISIIRRRPLAAYRHWGWMMKGRLKENIDGEALDGPTADDARP